MVECGICDGTLSVSLCPRCKEDPANRDWNSQKVFIASFKQREKAEKEPFRWGRVHHRQKLELTPLQLSIVRKFLFTEIDGKRKYYSTRELAKELNCSHWYVGLTLKRLEGG